jgi:hypothetical protein
MKILAPQDYIENAKKKFLELFKDRLKADEVFLEEVEPLEDMWKITLSFFDKNEKTNNFSFEQAKKGLDPFLHQKHYKVVYLDLNGNLLKIKNHEADF